jgi:hypothetical protein
MKKSLIISSMAVGCLALVVGLVLAPKLYAASGGSSQTAQSIMVSMTPDSNAFQISGTTTWTFDRDCAEADYTASAGGWDGNTPTCTGNTTNCAPANQPTPPPAPPVDPHGPNSIEHHAQQDRCTFFCGGTLDGWNYTNTQTVDGLNGHGNWTFTYNYTVTTVGSVGEATCWTCDQSGGGAVDVKFCGFVAGESFLKKARDNSGWDKKYSFTLTAPDPITGLPVSRVTNVMATLQASTDMGTTWNDVQGPFALDTSSIVSCGRPNDLATFCDNAGIPTDYVYDANAGFGGNVAAVGNFLHSSISGHLAPDLTNNIMSGVPPSPDNFPNNNNNLCPYSETAPFSVDFPGITQAGNYRVHVTGTVKGNAGVADQTFSVTGGGTVIGGCDGCTPVCNPE